MWFGVPPQDSRDESVEQLGISLQQLGRKAFPSIHGKELDRLLKDRFFQALLGHLSQMKLSMHCMTRVGMIKLREKKYSADSRVES